MSESSSNNSPPKSASEPIGIKQNGQRDQPSIVEPKSPTETSEANPVFKKTNQQLALWDMYATNMYVIGFSKIF